MACHDLRLYEPAAGEGRSAPDLQRASADKQTSLQELEASVHLPPDLSTALRRLLPEQCGPSQLQEAPPHWQLRVYRLRLPAKVAKLACGGAHTLASMEAGGLWAWGDNRHAQCGQPASAAREVPTPQPVEAFVGVQLADVSAGGQHSVAAAADGACFSWGHGRWAWCDVGLALHVSTSSLALAGL